MSSSGGNATRIGRVSPGLDRAAVFYVVVLAVAMAMAWLGLRESLRDYHHPDEVIATSVVNKVLTGTLDTNWARSDVVEHFRYNQFNFSSYYLFAGAVEAVTAAVSDPPSQRTQLQRLRRLSVVLAALAIVLAAMLGRRLGGNVAGVTAALGTAASVTLFQDALYARPETFCTVLMLGFALVLTSRAIGWNARLAWSGLILGVLVASKITFAALLPFPILAATIEHQPRLWRGVAGYFALLGGGFALGAPFAVLQPAEYLEGVGYLMRQYGGGHWPHGLPSGSLGERLAHSGAYLTVAIGLPALLLAAYGMARMFEAPKRTAAVVFIGVLLMLAYFLQTRTFFERNLSQCLPFLFVLAGLGLSHLIAYARRRLPGPPAAVALVALVALVILVPARATYRLVTESLSGRHASRIAAVEQRLSDEGYTVIDVLHVYEKIERIDASHCGKLAFRATDFGEAISAEKIGRLRKTLGLDVLAHLKGPFQGIPTSTLQAYHNADLWFLARPMPRTDCALALVNPKLVTGDPIAVDVALGGDAKIDGAFPDPRTRPWRGTRYATWSGADSNVGHVSIGPFDACGDIAFPVIRGPSSTHTRLVVQKRENDVFTTLYDGEIPALYPNWNFLRLPQGPAECSALRIEVHDAGRGWGEWAGIGQPVRLPASS